MREHLANLDTKKNSLAGTNRAASSINVVIVSYNSREFLRGCLVSLVSEPWEQVLVVDNRSSDGSVEMVRRDFPWVSLIISETNNGYGAAANLAIESCLSPYVLVLNSDTVLQPGALQALGNYLDQHPQVAVAGPQLVNPDGTYQVSYFEFPTPLQTLLRETSLSHFIRHSPKLSSGELAHQSAQSGKAVPWVLGAALAIRRAAFKAVGGFDESFFMYFEEVDLCYRLNQSDWQTHLVPEAVVMHIGGASTKRHRAAMLQQLYRSLCYFYQQHYSTRKKIQLKVVLTYLMFRNLLKDKLRSFRPTINAEPADNLSIWRSILSSVWAKNGWLKD